MRCLASGQSFGQCGRNVTSGITLASLNSSQRLYSKDTTQSTQSGSITDELLKAKVASETKSEESDKSKDEKKEEKKKDSRFTGKNAWKLGILMLGGMSVMTGSSLLMMWGECEWQCCSNETDIAM